MNCSLIVCAHNPRKEYLQRVLNGLKTQTFPVENWELILVDNASSDKLSGQFDLSWHPNARHVREEDLGLTPARLRGIRESKADILVFVDDDTVLAPDYLTQAITIGREWPFIGAWGGSCCPEFETPLPSWVGNQIWRLTVVNVKEDIWSNLKNNFTTMPVGAGMCVRRKVAACYFEKCALDRQRASLDRTGNSLAGYGDVDLCHCALDLGLGTARSKRLSLTHLIPASRLTLDYFVRHAEGDAISLMIFRAGRGFPIREPKPPTLVGKLRWFLHRLKNRVPREQYEIQKAHERGCWKGYRMAMEMKLKNNPATDGLSTQSL